MHRGAAGTELGSTEAELEVRVSTADVEEGEAASESGRAGEQEGETEFNLLVGGDRKGVEGAVDDEDGGSNDNPDD